MSREIDKLNDALSNIGTPLEQELAQVERAKADCLARKDPNSFYFILDTRNGLSVIWEHGMTHHLGFRMKEMTDIFQKTHPMWFPLDMAYSFAAANLSQQHRGNPYAKKTTFTTSVPLLLKDDTYHWYYKISSSLVHDSENNPVIVLVHYFYLSPYDNLVPTSPVVDGDPRLNDVFHQAFLEAAEENLRQFLSENISPANLRVLYAFRQLIGNSDGKPETVTKSAVAKYLDSTPAAVSKAVVRIMKYVRVNYPHSVTGTVVSFASFLNDICGVPDKV